MSDVPMAREIVRQVEEALRVSNPTEAAMLREALGLMTRERPAKPRGAATKSPVTPEIAEQIRAYINAHPGAHIQDVAVMFNTNSGRVSEAINGLR